MANENRLKTIISHCKEYGFVYPSSEIYDGLQAVYDYGPYGIELKKNITDAWWKAMTQYHHNIVGIDAAIFMHPRTWKASGHVDSFNDPMIDNKDSKKRYRADNLIEDFMENLQEKINKEVSKGRKRFGDNFDEEKFLNTNEKVIKYKQKIDEVQDKFKKALDDNDLKALKNIIEENEITCPVSGTANWTDVRQFNLMFSTQMGAISSDKEAGDEEKVYLRPETAQGIFVNFLNVMHTSRQKIPFGIAQVGKSFRNEIVARQFIFRTREFEQMEMQFFIRPGEEMEWYEHWKDKRLRWHKALGFPAEKLQFHDHLKPAHYANAAVDIEYDFPFGFKEIEGIHSRTDYDLKQHQEFSGKKMTYFDPGLNKSYIPYVVETAIGLGRMFLAVICQAYTETVDQNNKKRIYLDFHPYLAPVKAAIFPLTRKDGLPEKAMEIYDMLKYDFNIVYEDRDSIGKRYARQDLIGTPYCIAVDHQTLTDETVTIRYRNSMNQERVKIEQLNEIIGQRISIKQILKEMESYESL